MTTSARDLARRLADDLETDWRTLARPNQLPPEGDWSFWLQLGGRGSGKTWSGSHWVREQALSSTSRIALIGPTAADVRDIMIEGVSGILTISPDWDRPTYEPSKRKISFANGATAMAFSADEPEHLRGPNFSAIWMDELCAWRYPQAAWDNAMLALRIGKNPRCCITTTPKPTKLLRELLAREGQDVVVSRTSTFDNEANLAPSFLSAIVSRYRGTRLGRQELYAEVLTDIPGALWQRSWIDETRIDTAPDLTRIVVAVDPAVSTTEGADETGIIVAGIGKDEHGYVLDDLSGKYQPHEWAARAIAAFHQHKADRIIAEVNQGGAMVESTVRVVDAKVPFKAVHASRGKVTRAEPVAALYEQRKVHHVGTFDVLEDQLCSFTSDFDRARAGYSPDRLDALTWAASELMLGNVQPIAIPPGGGVTWGGFSSARHYPYESVPWPPKGCR
jgi:predicted phage terminase large subunit-like protein